MFFFFLIKLQASMCEIVKSTTTTKNVNNIIQAQSNQYARRPLHFNILGEDNKMGGECTQEIEKQFSANKQLLDTNNTNSKSGGLLSFFSSFKLFSFLHREQNNLCVMSGKNEHIFCDAGSQSAQTIPSVKESLCPHKKRKCTIHDISPVTSKHRRRRTSSQKNMWKCQESFPSIHKYDNILNIFHDSVHSKNMPSIYILHFDNGFDIHFFKAFTEELLKCKGFEVLHIYINDKGMILNNNREVSLKQKSRIPIYVVEYSGIINDNCISNLKILGFKHKVYLIIILNRNILEQYCSFMYNIPEQTYILHNGVMVEKDATSFQDERNNSASSVYMSEEDIKKVTNMLGREIELSCNNLKTFMNDKCDKIIEGIAKFNSGQQTDKLDKSKNSINDDMPISNYNDSNIPKQECIQ